MKAIAVHEGETTPSLIDLPQPEPDAGEALVRTLRVGVDGTDHEVIGGGHGGFPADTDHMVLGHEAVGVVEDATGTDLSEGDIVVPTVRRRPNGTNDYFERGEPDMAPDGQYHERGIVGAHGFMAEYFTTPAAFLVTVPPELVAHGFLVEPISITQKAVEHADASRSAFEWTPESALVLGNGSLGLITLAMFEQRFDRTYCVGRRERPDPTIDIIESLGGTYLNSSRTPVPAIPDEYEAPDLIYESTGYAKHPFESIEALAPNGVLAALGIPGDWDFEIEGGKLHRELVLHNKAVVGSVNSNVGHFEAAVDTLASLPEPFLAALVTGVYELDNYEDAFVDDNSTIKNAIQFSSYEERR